MTQNKKYYSNLFLSLIAYIVIHTVLSTVFAIYLKDMGISYILATIISSVPPLMWMGKDKAIKEFKEKREKINLINLLILMLAVFSINIIGGLLSKAILDFVQSLGIVLENYSVEVSSASDSGISYSLIFYAIIISPIFEELVFRLVLFRSVEKINVRAAIIISSILFGIMHGNLDQAISVIPVGIFYGYLAHRYSMIVPIAVHISNNLLTNLIAVFKDQDAVIMAIMGLSLIALIISMISAFKYFRNNKEKLTRNFPYYVQLASFWGFVLFNIAIIIMSEM